jgi:hypothetical protein
MRHERIHLQGRRAAEKTARFPGGIIQWGRDFMAKRTVRSETADGEGRNAGGWLPDEEPVPPPVRSSGRSDSGDAFFPDPEGGPARAPDDLAETLAEDFLASATTGNDVDDEVMNQVVPEEIGGPFIETTASEEFADGYDESNPEDAEVEGRPMAVSGVVALPREE